MIRGMCTSSCWYQRFLCGSSIREAEILSHLAFIQCKRVARTWHQCRCSALNYTVVKVLSGLGAEYPQSAGHATAFSAVQQRRTQMPLSTCKYGALAASKLQLFSSTCLESVSLE